MNEKTLGVTRRYGSLVLPSGLKCASLAGLEAGKRPTH